MIRHIAVIDIGKTNAKLALVDAASLTELAVISQPNIVLTTPPYRHFDVERHWEFLLAGLQTFQSKYGIDAITVTTHGACCALLGQDETLAAPILDYEDTGPDQTASAYAAIRPAFAQTGSPRLPMGLNIGAQLFWQFARDPDLLARTAHIVTYPQFWAHRLCGVLATDVTSLGCHTDLWLPDQGAFSPVVDRLGIRNKLAPIRHPADILGTTLPSISDRTGVPANTPVACGIHDSNASLYPYLASQNDPFAVVSTGTWVICMAVGGPQITLDPLRDTLINIDANGNPTRSARFMGGREYELMTGGGQMIPDDNAVAAVLSDGPMLMPAVVSESGPFQGQTARWIGTEPARGTPEHAAAISFYLALMTATCLTLTGAKGPIQVEGAFTRNSAYLAMLASATGRQVRPNTSKTGTSIGAAMLFGRATNARAASLPIVQPDPSYEQYARRWNEVVKTAPGT